MKNNFYRTIGLTLLSFVLPIYSVLGQGLYRVAIKQSNGVQVGQPFSSSNDINELVDDIYQRIKPPGNPRPIISIEINSMSLNQLQNLMQSKGVFIEYYEFPQNSLLYKSFGEIINADLIGYPSKNYGLVLKKSGYRETDIIPFKVTQTADNNTVLNFSNSKVNLYDERRISFILNTNNLGLDRGRIADALNSRDYRLSLSHYDNLEAYHSCIDFILNNPMAQFDCEEVDVVVVLSR
ncbi:MAG: hypothetical protein WBM44_21925 [Waterburya sp.]